MLRKPDYSTKPTDSGAGLEINVQGRVWGFIYRDDGCATERWSAFPNYAQGGKQFGGLGWTLAPD